jgi:hypothetical protein
MQILQLCQALRGAPRRLGVLSVCLRMLLKAERMCEKALAYDPTLGLTNRSSCFSQVTFNHTTLLRRARGL